MNKDFLDLTQQLFKQKLHNPHAETRVPQTKNPVHVVYGGADRFSAETPQKFGKIALNSLEIYAPNFVEFANAMWLKGCETLPNYSEIIADLEFRLIDNNEKLKRENYNAWFAWTIYNRVIEKLKREPVEDFRIDFEDGYGIRPEEEEDNHALAASEQLAVGSWQSAGNTEFCGVRIKSFQAETYRRSVRTLNLFITNLLQKTGGILPDNFAVTLPKVTKVSEVEVLCELLETLENRHNLPLNVIKIEIMIETPESILIMKDLVAASRGRCVSAHFGAYDYTASFGITAVHQHLRHEACNFARQMMQISLSPLNIRLSDSVTTEMPVPVHRGENLSAQQLKENKQAVHKAWRLHFNNVINSQINGFYQSWDLHPAQLVARYAAVYSFFLESFNSQSVRLKGFMNKATKATMSGNQFDDAASAQGLLNYFLRGINCGALTENEVFESATLTLNELKTESFVKIMENR
jgi:citrate lyase beta subunit